MVWIISLLNLLLSFNFNLSATGKYEGYKTYRVEPSTAEHYKWLTKVQHSKLGKEMDFWKTPHRTTTKHQQTDIMVQPELQAILEESLHRRQVPYDVIIDNIQEFIDRQKRRAMVDSEELARGIESFDYSKYHTYEEIQQWITDFAELHSSIAEEFQISTSFEGRPIKGVKLGNKIRHDKALYFQGGIHAREWISPAMLLFVIKSLVSNYGHHNTVTRLLDSFDVYIVPVLNVDGYVYTWTKDRMWRKTRSTREGDVCQGIDLNRNYGYKWGGEGAKHIPCSDIYCGPFPYSEPEINGSTNYLMNLNQSQDFVAFLDFHSYSQMLLSPWSYSSSVTTPNDYADQMSAAAKMAAALESVHGTKYEYGPSVTTLSAPASGCSQDWAYGALGVKYAFIMELRDLGKHGFLLPDDQIIPTGQETFAAIVALARHVLQEYSQDLWM